MNNNNKSFSKILSILVKLFGHLNFHTISLTEWKEISKNNSDYLLSILKVLFCSINYIKNSEIDNAIVRDLFTNFPIESICQFLSEELIDCGWLCCRTDLRQPIDCLFAFHFLWESIIVDKLIQKSLFFPDPISIDLKQKQKIENEFAENRSNNSREIDDAIRQCAVVKQRIDTIVKQIDTLSQRIESKIDRLKQTRLNIDSSLANGVELIYLVKNSNRLERYLTELANRNEFLSVLIEWCEFGESGFRLWVDELRLSLLGGAGRDDVPSAVVDCRGTEMEKCRLKLFECEKVVDKIDKLWRQSTNGDDFSCLELVCRLNAECFVGTCLNRLSDRASSSIHRSACVGSDSLFAVDEKLRKTNEIFCEKYRRKLKKMSQWVDGLILDGSH